jgi:hypothetical protein
LNQRRLAAIAAALAIALPARAAQKMTAPAPAEKRPAPATRPARASVAPAQLPPPPAASSRPRVAWFGASVGAVSAFDLGKGMGLTLDYGLVKTPPTWRKLALEWHLAATLARPTGETPLTTTVVPPTGFVPVTVDAGKETVEAYVFEVVPTARVRWNLTPGVAFFGDGGLGLCQTVEQYHRDEMFVGRSDRTDYVTGVVAYAGVGLSADVAERWRVVFKPVAFSLQLGPKFSAFTPSLGVAYRL